MKLPEVPDEIIITVMVICVILLMFIIYKDYIDVPLGHVPDFTLGRIK